MGCCPSSSRSRTRVPGGLGHAPTGILAGLASAASGKEPGAIKRPSIIEATDLSRDRSDVAVSLARRWMHRTVRRAMSRVPVSVREVALAFATRTCDGPALLPGPPPGPVLVVAPHPDDETIGVGGALARHALAGDAVTVVVATSGERTSGGGRRTKTVAAAREAECRAACADLGIGEPVFLRLPDSTLGDRLVELTAAVGKYGRDARVVYLPSLLDPHRDHRAANAAVAAAGLAADTYGYEVWSAGLVDVVLDVGAVYQDKERALRRYATALEAVDYVRAARGLATYRSVAGGLGGSGFAEGFLRLPGPDHAALVVKMLHARVMSPDHNGFRWPGGGP
jgi:LmbE family N-acetylglucosaminyl deacetylase